jgi:hypothetical protein
MRHAHQRRATTSPLELGLSRGLVAKARGARLRGGAVCGRCARRGGTMGALLLLLDDTGLCGDMGGVGGLFGEAGLGHGQVIGGRDNLLLAWADQQVRTSRSSKEWLLE